MVRRRAHKWFANSLLIGVIVMAIYLGIIGFDYRIPIVNPPDTLTVLPLHPQVYYGEARYSPTRPPDLDLGLFLHYNGTLWAGKAVIVTGIANVSVDVNNEPILMVQVLFQISHVYPPRNNSLGIPVDTGLFLFRVPKTTTLKGAPVTIYWPVPGDFGLIIRSGTAHYVIESTSPLNTVHVEPESEGLTEKFNRVGQGLTLALTYFAFIEAISIYLEYREEPVKKKSPPTHQEEQQANQSS